MLWNHTEPEHDDGEEEANDNTQNSQAMVTHFQIKMTSGARLAMRQRYGKIICASLDCFSPAFCGSRYIGRLTRFNIHCRSIAAVDTHAQCLMKIRKRETLHNTSRLPRVPVQFGQNG